MDFHQIPKQTLEVIKDIMFYTKQHPELIGRTLFPSIFYRAFRQEFPERPTAQKSQNSFRSRFKSIITALPITFRQPDSVFVSDNTDCCLYPSEQFNLEKLQAEYSRFCIASYEDLINAEILQSKASEYRKDHTSFIEPIPYHITPRES